MAANADEKTEPATPRRRQEARSSGQVARSQDLTAATLLLTAMIALFFIGPQLWLAMMFVIRRSLSSDSPTALDEILPFAGESAIMVSKPLGIFLAILFFMTLISVYVQVGWLFTLKPLTPTLGKINPLKGLKRLFSVRSVMRALISFTKLLAVAALAYVVLSGSAAAIIYSFSLGLHDVVNVGASLTIDLGIRLTVTLFILALFDLAWQRYRHEKDMRMTKEEVKDELRSMDGDPQIKRRRRQVQLQMAMKRLRQDVPTADVVVTNPTHLAIAIRYDADSQAAPKVVAKGADYLALRIRQIATEFGIPIVERKALARAMYDSVEVGQYIPERFYRAIAEILAYVYELTGKTPTRVRGGLAPA